MIYHFSELDSTNLEIASPRYREGDWVVAEWQRMGRGQRGHSWSAARGENLTASLCLEPTFLPATEQFRLLEALSLGVADYVAELGFDPRIKWTNDIYLGHKKLAGILIEHSLGGANLRRTIFGLGLNVNQRQFDSALPNPTSLSLLGGQRYQVEEVLQGLDRTLMARYAQLRRGDNLHPEYLARAYRLGALQRFRRPSGEEFEATITTIHPTGELELLHAGRSSRYRFNELFFVVDCG